MTWFLLKGMVPIPNPKGSVEIKRPSKELFYKWVLEKFKSGEFYYKPVSKVKSYYRKQNSFYRILLAEAQNKPISINKNLKKDYLYFRRNLRKDFESSFDPKSSKIPDPVINYDCIVLFIRAIEDIEKIYMEDWHRLPYIEEILRYEPYVKDLPLAIKIANKAIKKIYKVAGWFEIAPLGFKIKPQYRKKGLQNVIYGDPPMLVLGDDPSGVIDFYQKQIEKIYVSELGRKPYREEILAMWKIALSKFKYKWKKAPLEIRKRWQ